MHSTWSLKLVSSKLLDPTSLFINFQNLPINFYILLPEYPHNLPSYRVKVLSGQSEDSRSST